MKKNSINRFVSTSDQSDDNSNGLLLTNKRFIWMNLRHSILVYDIKTGNLTALSSKNGLPSGENSSKHLHYDNESKQVLIGFTNQVTSVPLQFIVGPTTNPQLYLTGLRALKNNAIIDFMKPVKLASNNNDLKIEFSLIDYDNAILQPFFEYRLHNEDPWKQIGSQSTLNLNNLGHGTYHIEIRETGSNANSPKSKASLSFIINPHFYQTAWFYVAILLVILAIFYVFYQYRIRQIKNIHSVREKIATDLHDDIGARLTNIGMLSVFGEDEKTTINQRITYLKKISEEALASGEALDEIVRNMQLHDEELDDITARMRRYASDIFENGYPLLHMTVDDNIIFRQLELEKKRDLYLAFKEIISNIAKHAGAKNVMIDVKATAKMFYLEINDDGKGFNPDEFTDRNGLKNIKSRISKWKGEVIIQSVLNKGTQIIIHLPFEKKSHIKRIFRRK
jgi:two-component sensor histidine kinase